MHTIELKQSALRAALTHAASKDARYYLCGICIDFDAGRIVATDGHRMFIAECDKVPGMGRVIIPDSAVKDACRVKLLRGQADTVAVSVSAMEGKIPPTFELAIGSSRIAGTCIDGVFPDYQRVIPNAFNGVPAQYNADYLADAQESLRVYHGNSKLTPRIEYNGQSAGVMHANIPGAFVVIMPMRTDDAMDRDMAAFIGCTIPAPLTAAA